MKDYKVVFIDLDGTLIETRTDNVFPKGVYDMQIRFDTFNALKKLNPKFIIIVTNQGGIHEGYVDVLSFIAKLNYIKRCLVDYIHCHVYAEYCPAIDKDNEYRKPNVGMLNGYMSMLNQHNIFKGDCLLVGDRTEDKLTAENFGIDFINVCDFVK